MRAVRPDTEPVLAEFVGHPSVVLGELDASAAAQVDIRTVAGRLGHSGGGTTTFKAYTAWVSEADQRAARGIGTGMPGRPIPMNAVERAKLDPQNPYEKIAAELVAGSSRVSSSRVTWRPPRNNSLSSITSPSAPLTVQWNCSRPGASSPSPAATEHRC